MEARCSFRSEFRVVWPDASLHWIVSSGEFIYDAKGQAVRMRGMVQDVTDRKRVELEVRQGRADMLTLLNNLPFLAWLKNAEGRFIAVNEPFARACGHASPEDVVGKSDLDVWSKDLAEAYRAEDLAVMQSRNQRSVEEIIRDQGVDIWFETYKAPMFDPDGKVIGTTGFARDITERKQAEIALRESEQKYRNLLNIQIEKENELLQLNIELERSKSDLEKKNIALTELAEHLERTKNKLKDDIAVNINDTILPILERMKLKKVAPKYIELISHHLEGLTSSLGRKVVEKDARLSPRQVEICNLLQAGMTSKEIAEMMNISLETAESHRRDIRKKLGISGKKVNLTSWLRSRSDKL